MRTMYCCGDSYVIRIYRREKNDPHQMVGQVEIIGRDEEKAFASIEELWGILGAAKKIKRKRRRSSTKPETG